ncbi:hypothetical protein Rumeso_01131 [Rubellimicrobium mesophilum DSM 19309]|uniref:Uncharacterized protein n=1 Tax=Rubellimicrobium mesophilum DSM 19309 TaxID=442562 RepID=A0A017HSC2_9RHOB|nr:hypothetical protein Rumeso_01131 [Rubellimicrobium mesophilum DSM 19309]
MLPPGRPMLRQKAQCDCGHLRQFICQAISLRSWQVAN